MRRLWSRLDQGYKDHCGAKSEDKRQKETWYSFDQPRPRHEPQGTDTWWFTSYLLHNYNSFLDHLFQFRSFLSTVACLCVCLCKFACASVWDRSSKLMSPRISFSLVLTSARPYCLRRERTHLQWLWIKLKTKTKDQQKINWSKFFNSPLFLTLCWCER